MGWKGTVRSVGAAMRRAERDARRRQRELERQRQKAEKLAAIERARLEVACFENYLERLVTLHHEEPLRVDWNRLARAPEPDRPQRGQLAETKARAALDAYWPSWWDRLWNLEARRRLALEQAVERAVSLDEQAHRSATTAFETRHDEWRQLRELASRVLAGEPEALVEAFEAIDPLSEMREIGSELELRVVSGEPPHVLLRVHGDDVVPSENRTLLQSGRVSRRAMPKRRYHEIYEDHVCSAILRVARDVLGVLPVSAVVVTASDSLLDTSTGHLAEQAILSVAIPRATLDSLQLLRIDPSDSFENFVHRSGFQRGKGFAAVEPLEPATVFPPPSADP